MSDYSQQINKYLDLLKNTIDNLDRAEISKLIDLFIDARENGRNIFVMGNGGSASAASHMVCDFNKGVSYGQEKRFKIICLNDSLSTVTAYANDVGYEIAFVEQLKNFLTPNDLVLAISGSGNSKNIVLAIDYANSVGATTIGITGYHGGKLKQMAKYSVNANVDDMQVSEDIHMILNHLVMKILYLANGQQPSC